jgi:LuxR family maltose regulon positive regulatory protein
VAPLLGARNAADHVQIALAQGDLTLADRWAGEVTESADASPLFPQLELTPVRLLLARAERSSAAGGLEALYRTALDAGCQYGAVEVRAAGLAAITRSTALALLEEALEMAQPKGYMRTSLDKGQPMADLVWCAAAHGISQKYVSKLLPVFQAELSAARAPSPEVGNGALVDLLSDRELQALRLLTERRSHREIAQDLMISLNTVKTHLKNIWANSAFAIDAMPPLRPEPSPRPMLATCSDRPSNSPAHIRPSNHP